MIFPEANLQENENENFSEKILFTLDYQINVGLRLLISGPYSQGYALIR